MTIVTPACNRTMMIRTAFAFQTRQTPVERDDTPLGDRGA
jgi:hypothetical protein